MDEFVFLDIQWRFPAKQLRQTAQQVLKFHRGQARMATRDILMLLN